MPAEKAAAAHTVTETLHQGEIAVTCAASIGRDRVSSAPPMEVAPLGLGSVDYRPNIRLRVSTRLLTSRPFAKVASAPSFSARSK